MPLLPSHPGCARSAVRHDRVCLMLLFLWGPGAAEESHPEVGFNDEDSLTIVVIGASGDLAKKKTFPALYELHLAGLLPRGTTIAGYARSKLSNEKFRVRAGCMGGCV